MTSYTPDKAIPYPDPNDLVTNGDDAMKALAERVAALLVAHDDVHANLGLWQAYTPLWTGDGSTKPTKGNAALTGRYCRIGRTIFFRLHLSYGSTSAGGNGGWYFSLPVPCEPTVSATSGAVILTNGCVVDLGTALYQVTGAGGLLTVAGVDYVDVKIPSGTGRTAFNVGATQPFAFGTGDTVAIAGVYEAAS